MSPPGADRESALADDDGRCDQGASHRVGWRPAGLRTRGMRVAVIERTGAVRPPCAGRDDLPFLDEERGAAILLPAALVVLRAHGPLLAVADDGDATGLHALTDEVAHRRARGTLANAGVALVGATRGTVTRYARAVCRAPVQTRGVR